MKGWFRRALRALTAPRPRCLGVLSVSSSLKPPPMPGGTWVSFGGGKRWDICSHCVCAGGRWSRRRRRAEPCRAWALGCRGRAGTVPSHRHPQSTLPRPPPLPSPSGGRIGPRTLLSRLKIFTSEQRRSPTALSKSGSPVYLKTLAFKKIFLISVKMEIC